MKNGIFAIIGIPAAIFGIAYFTLSMMGFFAPKYESIRRDVQIESRAYTEASIRRLYDLHREWRNATPEGKATIEATARHEFSIFPSERLPADLNVWYQAIR